MQKSKHDIPKMTINLSSYTTTDTETRLLDKGLLFIPTIKTLPVDDILTARDKLVRNLKLKAHFKNDDNNYDPKVKKFVLPSKWEPNWSKLPDDVKNTISSINISTHTLLQELPCNTEGDILLYPKNNLTLDESKALNNLKNNSNIIIKSADKGGALTILDRDAYIEEAYRQLNDPKYYKKLQEPLLNENVKQINTILDIIYNNKFITKRQLNYLSANINECNERVFYLLPKIHKEPETWPRPGIMPAGRPIVSDCGSESYRVSEYIDSFLTPLACQHPSYLKDTYDFVSKIRDKPVKSNSFLVTGDVSSLYTNMDLDRIMSVVTEAFNVNPNNNRPTTEILQLLDLTLKNNDFNFNGDTFLQIHGTAMGKKYAPALANLYMVYFDSLATTGFRIKPEYFFRFLDDIFFNWSGTKEELEEYNIFLNSIIPGIKLTICSDQSAINFLDTTVYKFTHMDQSLLKTKVYFKPTDTHQLLHTDSFHPKHTHTGILKSQILRYKRISSTFTDYESACHTLFSVLQIRGYSKSKLRKMKRDIWCFQEHDNTTEIVPKVSVGRSKIIPIVLRYSQVAHKFIDLWKGIIEQNTTFSDYRTIAAYSKNKNLGNFLVRSKLTAQNTCRSTNQIDFNPQAQTDQDNGSFNFCGAPTCVTCKFHGRENVHFTSFQRNSFFKIHSFLNCKTTNIVYLISCEKCYLQYVGETGRSLADRVREHRSNIKQKKKTPISIHFNSENHSVDDLSVMAIEKISDIDNPKLLRRQRESFWQRKLGTKYPEGLNLMPIDWSACN